MGVRGAPLAPAGPPGGDVNEAGGASPRPWGATPQDPGASSPLAYAPACGTGPTAAGVTADGADGLSNDATGGETGDEGVARAQDEPLLTARPQEPPRPTGTGADAGASGRRDDSGDETMPPVDPQAPSPAQTGDVPMVDGDGDGVAPTPARDGSAPDASMPDGSGGGEGSAPVPPPAGSAPAAGRTPGRKRKEPCYRGPRERSPHGWVTSIQLATRNKATCRDCLQEFQSGEIRVSTLVNARSNRSCYSHVHCIPDGLHPLDTLEPHAPVP